ncbi:MAG: hypothetical protein O2854_07985, partial [Chloroflexi bacterium]|nr:hypothetical protein [Chloroflexota bacterium]
MTTTKSFEHSLRTTLVVAIGAGLLLVLLTPLIVNAPPLPITYFPFVVGKALYFRTITEVVFGLWLILAFRFPEYRLPRSWVMITFALFLGASLISSFAGVSPTRSLWSTYERMQGVIDLAHWVVFVMVVATVLKTFTHWRWLFNANLAVSLLLALLGILQAFGVEASYLISAERVGSSIGNPVYLGAIMVVNVFIACALFAATFEDRNVPSTEQSKPDSMRRRRQKMRPVRMESFTYMVPPVAW